MKTLIVYESTHGSTEKCALRLKELLNGETTLVSLRENPIPDINNYHNIIIGGSIHSGEIQTGIRRFCEEYSAKLKVKKIGLYLCCMEEGRAAEEQFEHAYPDELKELALASGLFGGEFHFNKMNRTQKLIAEKVSGIRQSVSKIKQGQIIAFANTFNQAASGK